MRFDATHRLARSLNAFFKAAAAHLKGVTPVQIVAVVVLFTTVLTFALKGDLRGNTLSAAMLPEVAVYSDDSHSTSPEADSARAQLARYDEQIKVESYVDEPEALQRMEPLPVQEVDNETLWLARVIYSETKRAEEQELVAWVVRNRVETQYRGKASYQAVALDPYQFSAFNPGTRTRRHYTSLDARSKEAGFQNALAIAKQVKEAPAAVRPFSETTRHFFSEQSMAGGRHPGWSKGKQPVRPEREFTLETRRFRFYEKIG